MASKYENNDKDYQWDGSRMSKVDNESANSGEDFSMSQLLNRVFNLLARKLLLCAHRASLFVEARSWKARRSRLAFSNHLRESLVVLFQPLR